MKLDFKKKDAPVLDEKKEKKENKLLKLFEKNKTNKLILVFLVLVFIVDTLILADAIHTKVATYKAIGSFVSGQSVNDGKAKKQGNLGNYNIVSKNNSVVDNNDGTYTLTVDLKFVNYGEEGYSFADAVDLTAYQENKEVKGGIKSEDLTLSFSVNPNDDDESKNKSADKKKDESNLKVKNGKSADVFLSFIINNPSKDVEIIMSSGANEFTYTVQLSKSQINPAPAQNAPSDRQQKQTPNQKAPAQEPDEEEIDDVEDLMEEEAADAPVENENSKEPA